MLKFLSCVSGNLSTSDHVKARPTFKPKLENLEDRRVPAAFLLRGNLIIQQSRFSDSAVVTEAPIILTQTNVSLFNPQIILPFTNINVQETINGVVQPVKSFSASAITGRIIYIGGAGNDTFDNQTSIKCSAYGQDGADKLVGGHNDDYLDGGNGNDALHAREGNDLMYGRNGNDLMRGGQGNDRMFGGAGLDDMFGALGSDYLDGGRDGRADILRGAEDADTFVAERYIRFRFPRLVILNRDFPKDFNPAEGDKII